jgi:hypothetical protein
MLYFSEQNKPRDDILLRANKREMTYFSEQTNGGWYTSPRLFALRSISSPFVCSQKYSIPRL